MSKSYAIKTRTPADNDYANIDKKNIVPRLHKDN